MNKSIPITQKCKSSPLKMNEALVQGEADAASGFTDFGAVVGEAFKEEKADNTDEKKATNVPAKDPKTDTKNFFTDKLKNFNMDDYKL